MRYLLLLLMIGATPCFAQNAHNCFKDIDQNTSQRIPAELIKMQQRLAAIDFYLEDRQKVVKRIEQPLTTDERIIAKLCTGREQFSDYNVFRLFIRKKRMYKDGYYPKFTITAYQFTSNGTAKVFFEQVLIPKEKADREKEFKSPYSCLLSGKYCFVIETPAYLYYYDFMDKIVKKVSAGARRLNH